MIVRNRTKALLSKGDVKSILEDSKNCHHKMKAKIMNHCAGCYDKEESDLLRKKLSKYGLTEFEIVNMIDTKPNGLVHLQNIIEEMTERLTEDQMQEIVDIFTEK